MSNGCGTSEFVAGSYAASVTFYDDQLRLLGPTDNGFDIEETHSAEDVTSDQWGDSVLDSVYRGGNCFVNMTLIGFNWDGVNRLRRAWSVNGKNGAPGDLGVIGCTALNGESQFRLDLVLTSPAGAANQPANYHFMNCALDVNFPLQFSLNSRLRVLPVRVRAYPYKKSDGPPEVWKFYETS